MARTKNKARKIGLLTSLLVLATVAVGGTLAYLIDTTDAVVNTFEPTSVPIEVVEDFDGETKKNVKIQNNGNIPAYIRATYVVNWADEEGNILGTPPVENEDYTIELNEGDWIECDGYYYHTKPVAANGETAVFIETCSLATATEDSENTVPVTPPDGYYLRVDVLAQSVQSVPEEAIEELWDVDVTVEGDGTIITITEKSN